MIKKNKTLFNLIVATVIFLVIKLLFPVVNGITPVGVNVIAIFFAIVYLWTFEGISWVSLLAIALFACSGALDYSAIAMNSFGSWVTVFTIASCILNYSLQEAGITDRIVKWSITRKAVQHKPWIFLIALFASIYLVNFILDCSPSALIFFPMTVAICEQIGCTVDEKLSKVVFLGVMMSILLGYVATPISHSIPILFIGLANNDFGTSINFIDYCKVGIPLSFVVFVLMILFFRFVVNPDVSKINNFDSESVLKTLTPLTKKQKIISVTYLLVILMWLCPTIFQNTLPGVASWITNAGYIFPVVIAIAFLVTYKIDDTPLLDFNAAANAVSWPLILLTAAIMVVNPCISAEASGITTFLSTTFGPIFANFSSSTLFILIAAIWVMVQTNFMSCFVSGQLVYTVMTPLAISAAALGINAPALGIMISIGCGLAFLSPPSSGPAAVFISTDYYTPGDAIKYGLPVLIISILACTFVAYPLGAMFF